MPTLDSADTGLHSRRVTKISIAAQRLPGVLKKKGWSLRRLEREAQLANGYLSKICRGERQPSANVAGKIERLLGSREMRAVLWSEFVSS